jgi:hypothetical protein
MSKAKTTSGRLTFSAAAALIGVDAQSFRTHYKRICPKVAAYPKGKQPYVSRTRLLAWVNVNPEILNAWREGKTRTALKLATNKRSVSTAKENVLDPAQKPKKAQQPKKAKPKKAKPKKVKKLQTRGPALFFAGDLVVALTGTGLGEAAVQRTLLQLMQVRDVLVGCEIPLVQERVEAITEDAALFWAALDRAIRVQEKSPCCGEMRTMVLYGSVADAWAHCPYCGTKLVAEPSQGSITFD